MEKRIARKHYKEKRLALTDVEKDKLEDLILIQFQALNPVIPDHVMAFAPLEEKKEYDPHLVLEYCRFKNPAVQFYYPLTKGEEMVACAVTDDQPFLKNDWGILEPVDAPAVSPTIPELIFVPLLAVDKKGHRVGFGKGYYDKFLALCREDVVTIGFSFFDPEEKISGIEKHDIPLSACITPRSFFIF
jgi:5-formyltetrahydrofolate cyclo-ligase